MGHGIRREFRVVGVFKKTQANYGISQKNDMSLNINPILRDVILRKYSIFQELRREVIQVCRSGMKLAFLRNRSLFRVDVKEAAIKISSRKDFLLPRI